MALFQSANKFSLVTANELDHETLLALINNLTEAVLAIDKSGRITLSNGAALNLLNANTLTGQPIGQVFRPVYKSGQPIDIEAMVAQMAAPLSSRDWRLRYADGSLINLDISFSPVRLAFGSKVEGGYVLIFRDITREKSVEEERDEFISVASHELRTPVAVVEGNVSNALLLAERSKAADSVKQSLAAAHDQIIFLGNLINDLALLSRTERGSMALTIEALDINQLVDSLLHDYKPQAGKKGLSLDKSVELGPDSLKTSQLYVREILQNFVTNAIKYTEKGSITISVRKKVNGVEFEVTDTGIGISQGERGKLFTKFFRSDDWRVRKVNGTGLGLYVSAKLAKIIDGAIAIDSQLNKGTTARLFVPNFHQSNSSQ